MICSKDEDHYKTKCVVVEESLRNTCGSRSPLAAPTGGVPGDLRRCGGLHRLGLRLDVDGLALRDGARGDGHRVEAEVDRLVLRLVHRRHAGRGGAEEVGRRVIALIDLLLDDL